VYTILDAEGAPWLFAGTGLQNGSTLGDMVGGYGIEIDMATPYSPPGTRILARIPDLENLWRHMTSPSTDTSLE
jgi:hypothetical protein